jgi:hypothetical protein
VSFGRSSLPCLAAALALLATAAPNALAGTHPVRTARISGVVTAINARRHTLKLRVAHSGKLHRAGARAAAVGGFQTIVVVFGDATVQGPDGAVAVGDDVTVTTDGPAGPTTVAATIDVIGAANGGTAGQGAAVPGEVTAVDPEGGTLTLAVSSTDSQGQSQTGSVIVTVGASTILAVGSAGAGSTVTLADIAVGDHVVVFTDDAGVDPIAALAILDATRPGGNHEGGGDSPSVPPTPVAGTVTGIDAGALSLSIDVSSGPLAGQTVSVDTTDHTSFGGAPGAAGLFGFSDISVGDSVVAYTPSPTAKPIVAVGVVDQTPPAGGGGGSSPTAPVYDSLNGTVAKVESASLQVTVSGDGTLAGQTVTVAVNGATHYRGATTGGTAFTFGDIQVGDQVRVYTLTLDPSALVAVYIGDGPPASGGSGGSGGGSGGTPTPPPTSPPGTPTEPQRFGGVVTAVRGDGLTVTVVSGGSLNGQSVVVSVPSSASFQADPLTGAGKSLATISVGDAVEIFTDSETGSPIVAVGVSDDGVYSSS